MSDKDRQLQYLNCLKKNTVMKFRVLSNTTCAGGSGTWVEEDNVNMQRQFKNY